MPHKPTIFYSDIISLEMVHAAFTSFALLLLGGAVALILAVQHQSYVIEKFNQVRLILLDGGADCLAELEDLGVDFTTLGDQGTKKCPV